MVIHKSHDCKFPLGWTLDCRPVQIFSPGHVSILHSIIDHESIVLLGMIFFFHSSQPSRVSILSQTKDEVLLFVITLGALLSFGWNLGGSGVLFLLGISEKRKKQRKKDERRRNRFEKVLFFKLTFLMLRG